MGDTTTPGPEVKPNRTAVSKSRVIALETQLERRRWTQCDVPFPHLVARDVFRPQVYEELEREFLDWLRQGQEASAFSRNMPGYDALGRSFDRDSLGAFALFFSREWHDMIANLVGIEVAGYLSGGLHHHAVGSANGEVHNDLNPGWFGRKATGRELVIASPDECSYMTGERARADVEPVELMRAVAVLFYLANPPWSPGDGGATGLYRHRDDDVNQPAAVVPPHSNSLLVFECTPYSFHGFLSNRRSERNCLVMWLHREKRQVVERWGEAPIVYWNR